MVGGDQKDVFIGNECSAKKNMLNINHPVQNGLIENWVKHSSRMIWRKFGPIVLTTSCVFLLTNILFCRPRVLKIPRASAKKSPLSCSRSSKCPNSILPFKYLFYKARHGSLFEWTHYGSSDWLWWPSHPHSAYFWRLRLATRHPDTVNWWSRYHQLPELVHSRSNKLNRRVIKLMILI